MSQRFDILVVGAGHAGHALVSHLRRLSFEGSIGVIGEERYAPYQRPPLSKDFLSREIDQDALALGFDPEALDVTFIAGAAAAAIDRRDRFVLLSTGERVTFRKLALATGSRPRRLEVPGGGEILYLTTLTDCLQLQERLPSVAKVAIIGGGFIGLEVAATLRKLGRSVIVIEAQDRLLARSATRILSEYLAMRHAREGVELRFGSSVLEMREGAVSLSDGSLVPADAVIAGIGSLANDDLARAAGLACNNGILVDAFARTSDPNIVAAGDCTRHPNEYAPITPFRLESVQNAVDQAQTAAETLLGRSIPYRALPTFWSDQFDARIAMAGISQGADEIAVRGDPGRDAFSVFAFRCGRLIAVETVNRPKDQRAARKLLLTQGITAPQARDEAVDLATLVKERQAA